MANTQYNYRYSPELPGHWKFGTFSEKFPRFEFDYSHV